MRFQDFAREHEGRSSVDLRDTLGDGFLLVAEDSTSEAASSVGRFHTSDNIASLGDIRGGLLDAEIHLLGKPGEAGPMITVGRTDRSHVQLKLGPISKFHAYFNQDAISGRFSLADGGSRNGTQVNGTQLRAEEPYALRGGEEILFGGFVRATFHNARTLKDALQLVRAFR